MDWRVKALAYQLLQISPFGNSLYEFVQQHVTKSVEATPERIRQKIEVGNDYWRILRQHMPECELDKLTHVDLGSGWMPTIPFLLYCVGVNNQVLLDIKPHMRWNHVAGTVRTFSEIQRQEPAAFPTAVKRPLPPIDNGEMLESYFARLGIRYIAPYGLNDMLAITGLKYITCTQVLLHLSRQQLKALFADVNKCLRQGGGIFAAQVYLYDLFSDADPTIPKFNKLKYSAFVWDRIISSSFLCYNRLTARDYRQLLIEAGFEICEFRTSLPIKEDIEELRTMKLAPEFRHIPVEELACRNLVWVVR
jgi:hypothetical protein